MHQLSNFLLTLTRGALEKPAYEFKDWALSETKKLIPFDSCIWGMGSWVSEAPVIHTVHLHNLAGNFVESWMRFQHEDKLIREITQYSNRTFNVDLACDYGGLNIYASHCKDFCLEHVVATGATDPDTKLLNTMCLYRADINNPFTEQERNLKEILFQHLIEATRTNWLTNLPNMFSAHQRSSFHAIAAADNSGLLQVVMPSFVEVFREEWAAWKGPFLPPEILEIALQADGQKKYVGQSIVINLFRMNDLTLLRARSKVPVDSLSLREFEIAQQVADGNDYKTIAINLNISPATVRTHTTNLYLKLGINDKAKLATELSRALH